APLVGHLGEPAVEDQLVARGEGEARVVEEAVDVVGFDRVEALRGAHVEAGGEEWLEQVEPPDVEPALAGPAVRLAEGVRREPPGVGSPRLPGADVHVADDASTSA